MGLLNNFYMYQSGGGRTNNACIDWLKLNSNRRVREADDGSSEKTPSFQKDY